MRVEQDCKPSSGTTDAQPTGYVLGAAQTSRIRLVMTLGSPCGERSRAPARGTSSKMEI